MNALWPVAGLAGSLIAGAFAAAWPKARPRIGSRRVLVLSLVFGAFAAAAAFLAPDPARGVWVILTGATLAYVGLVDLRRFSIPLPGLILLAGLLGFDLWRSGDFGPRLIAGLAAGLVLETLRRLGGGKGMGAGDPVLAALAAALVGWRLTSAVIAAAALAPLILQFVTRRRGPVPFGFWLSLAAVAALAAPR